MDIKDYFKKLHTILDNYYTECISQSRASQLIEELVAEAKEAGLDVKTTSDLIDKIEPYSSYEEESSYIYDDEDESSYTEE